MHKRTLILFFISLSLIAVFFILPRNKEWAGTVFSYWKVIPNQQKNLAIETRMRRRFGNNYLFSKIIADSLKQKSSSQDAVILMPPTSYFKKMGIDYHVPEPAVFYYYTGVKTIWANSRDAIKADWYVHIRNGKFVLESAADKKALQDTITVFKNLGVSL